MTYVIAIPTYKRPDILHKKTLHWLATHNIPSSRIYIFVANSQEARSYKALLPTEYHERIVLGVKGITSQRTFIARYFPEGTCVVSADDDIEGLFRCRDQQSKPEVVSNLNAFFEGAFKTTKQHAAFLWGVYPVLNPFYMKPGHTSTNLKFILGTLHGFIVRHDESLYPSLPEKEDFEMSILYYLKDGKIIRFDDYAIKTKFHSPKGGLGALSASRLKSNEKAANELKRRYPTLGYVWHRKNTGVAEFRFYRS
jgi:hypothetical protein